MHVRESQESNIDAEESPLKKSSNTFSSADETSDTADYFEAWLKDLKPAFDLDEPASVQPTSRGGLPSFSEVLSFEGTLRLDCCVAGALRSLHGTLVVGETGQVEADIDVAVVIIEGEVRGDIRATERVEIGSRATVIGNIRAATISIKPGAVFEGRCIFMPNPRSTHVEVIPQRLRSVPDQEEQQDERLFVAVGR